MADPITVKDSSKRFDPHPPGTFSAVCVDVLDLGERVETFGGESNIKRKCAIVFATGQKMDNGELFFVHPEMTISMGEKANLRQFLENWRGRSYTPAQVEAGVQLEKLVGQTALLTIEHKESGKGRAYAKIRSVSPLPKEMAAPSVNGYQRPPWWAERKAEYAKTVAAFRSASATPGLADLEDFPPALEQDDPGVPF